MKAERTAAVLHVLWLLIGDDITVEVFTSVAGASLKEVVNADFLPNCRNEGRISVLDLGEHSVQPAWI